MAKQIKINGGPSRLEIGLCFLEPEIWGIDVDPYPRTVDFRVIIERSKPRPISFEARVECQILSIKLQEFNESSPIIYISGRVIKAAETCGVKPKFISLSYFEATYDLQKRRGHLLTDAVS
ncbi:MAG: hypothetical protein ACYDBV_13880 [Nitrospiria bacterium]